MVLVYSQHSSNFHCSRRKKRKRAKKKERGRERERVWFTGGVLLCWYPKAGFNKTSIWLSHRATSSKTLQQPSSPPESILGGLRAFAWVSLLPQQDRAFYWVRTIESFSLTYTYFGDWGWLQTQRMCQVCFKNLASDNQLFPTCQSTNKAKVVAETLHVEFTERGSPASLIEGARQAVYESLLWPYCLQYISIQPTETSVNNFFFVAESEHRVKNAQKYIKLCPAALILWSITYSGTTTINTK